jgi:hypothetical protein
MLRARLALGLAVGTMVTLGAAFAVLAQPSPGNQAGAEAGASAGGGATSASAPGGPAAAPPTTAPAPPSPVATPTPPAANAAPVQSNSVEAAAPTNSAPARQALAPPPPPPAPPKPVRSPVAILQALDKVTAETLRFAAPVGQPIRYKNLVFVVKACETSNLGQPTPEAAAYVQIDSAPLGAPGVAPPPAKQVFKGWMFANSPGLNPFQHPVYDAWLISCAAAAPPA